MKSIHLFLIFIVVILAQLFVPAKMIFDQEKIISTGTPYKFKTQPVDPSDPFKGKYIHLNYEMSSVTSTDTTWTNYQPIYVSLQTDSLGFAMIKAVTRNQPENGDYIKTSVDWYNYYNQTLNFSFPFDEFYMNEAKAYDAELAHIEAQQDSLPNNTYGLVYVLNGKGVLENVFVNDIPIAEYVDNQ